MGTAQAKPNTQLLSFDVRLPDDVQEDALRLLDATRVSINRMLEQLWASLDVFGEAHDGPAWKQADPLLVQRPGHGCRQERCELEVAGRILRAQAHRKQIFTLIAPILSQGLIRPSTQTRPAGKNRSAIKEALEGLLTGSEEDDASFAEMLNVLEQTCNFWLAHERFPSSYEEVQSVPLLSVGLLSYAGDDGKSKGQTYRLAVNVRQAAEMPKWEAHFRFRGPDTQGCWHWHHYTVLIPLPEALLKRLASGAMKAPTLREEQRPDGTRFAVLDFVVEVPATIPADWQKVERVLGVDWGVHSLLTATALDEHFEQVGRPFFLDTGGFDGKQARLRRQIDELKAKVAREEKLCAALPPEHGKRVWYYEHLRLLRREIDRCWRKYEQRNRALAHLASNVLLLLMQVHGCSLLCMESLKTLKSTGRGKGVRGRWRNYRNNSTIRGEIWRLLRYKCSLLGLHFQTCPPRGTSHTCPHCAQLARTYRSPAHRGQSVKWGRWLWCEHCGYNADRDYAASVNIARVGVAYLKQKKQASKACACSIADPRVKPASYTGAGSVLLLPPTEKLSARHVRGKICYYPGWFGSAFLQSSQPKAVFLRLCG